MADRRDPPRRSTGETPPEPPVTGRSGGAARGGLGEARRYSPRGRTVRESAGRDPFRPALELLQGERGAGPTGKSAGAAGKGTGAARKAAGSAGKAAGSAGRATSAGGKTAGSGGRAAGSGGRAAGSGGRTTGSGGRAATPPQPAGGTSARAAAPLRKAATPRQRTGAARSTATRSTASRSTATRSGAARTNAARSGAARLSAVKRAPTPRRPLSGKRPTGLGEPIRRLRVGTLIVLALFTVIAGRLVALQLTDARSYALAGLRDRLTTETLFAPRGAIYDRSDNVLAHSVEARYVFADPSMIKSADVQTDANALRDILGIPTSTLIPKLTTKTRANGSKDEFEYLARGVKLDSANAIMARKLVGIGLGPDEIREAPGFDLAANLIGFTGNDGTQANGLTGLYGLEAGYNDLLSGTDGSRTFEVGQGDLDTAIPGGYNELKPAHPGSSVQLTIDGDLEYQVQQILAGKMASENADFGCAVVLDVHTGEVLAQASYPDYNVEEPDGSTPAARLDSCTQRAVDPGSIHKVITLGAGLQTGAIQPDSGITLPGWEIKKGDTTFADTTELKAGTKITIPGILAYSSNVGAIEVAAKMTPQALYDYQLKFGLGKSTNEGLPNESAGLVQPPANWSGSSYGSIPIGMGVSVTPLQMAAVYATIANNGVYIKPHLIKATIGPTGAVHPAAAATSRQVLTPANAKILQHDLQAVVSAPGSTGHKAAVPQYLVAGKTGTGGLVVNGKYDPNEVGSFIGMAPADNPQYVIAVFAHSAGEGGDTSAPAFSKMMSFTLQHYGVAPSGARPPSFTLTE